MLTLTGYFDASGHQAGSTNVTLAGWLSTPEAWSRFEDEWRKALTDLGVPMFHMSEFAHHVGVYKHWSEPQRRIRFGRLAEIITSHTLTSLAVAVPVKDFEEEFTEEARSFVGGPYGFAASVLFLEAAHFIEETLKPAGTPFQIDYVFESGDPGAGRVLKLFQAVRKEDPAHADRLHLLSLRFEDKRQYVALQAADVLAYELYQHFPRQIGLNPRAPRRYNLRQLAANKSWDWRHLTREHMREDWAPVAALAAAFHTNHPEGSRNLAIRPAKQRSRRRSRHDR